MKQTRPNFFRWAFSNGSTIFFIFIFLFIAYLERFIEVPTFELIKTEYLGSVIIHGSEFVVSWFKFSKVLIFLLVLYAVVKFGIYYWKFIMKD